MNPFVPSLVIVLGAAWALGALVATAHAAEPAVESRVVQLDAASPYSDALEVKLRFSAKEEPGAFDVRKEKFTVRAPADINASWGLFIWIDAGNTPNLPESWGPVLARQRLVLIGAHQSGNARPIFDRFRMAIEAGQQMRRRHGIDPARVYVSGFSGGGRVASMLGVAYPDIFSGALPFMGVNFYKDLRAADGKTYGLSYLPDDELLRLAKRDTRQVLVTGEKDFNRANTRAAFDEGFRKEGFAHAHYLEVPGQAHSLPGAPWLEKALKLLDPPRR